eukprot:1770281-Rhodomonas_salina.1
MSQLCGKCSTLCVVMHGEKGQRLGLATTSAINEPNWEVLRGGTPLLTDHELEQIPGPIKKKWHKLMQLLQETRVHVQSLKRELNARGSPDHA